MNIRGLTVDPPLFLAPMAGLTHTAFRRMVARFGGCGCLFTEMLSARALRAEDPDRSPWLMRTPAEKPLSWQILASTPEEVEVAARAVARFGADAVDLNFGCPAPDIRKRGGGSRLMESPALASEIVRAARKSAGELPLSAKIRLGESEDEGYLAEFAAMLEEGGVDLIHVHARFRGDIYGRKPKWEWIGKVKRRVGVPVVGNGSIFSVADARACIAASGCDGLMVGRGAAQKPWIFNELAREVYGAEIEPASFRLADVWSEFASNLQIFPEEKRLGRLKEFTHYFALNYAFGHTLASQVQSSRAFEVAVERAWKFFNLTEGG